MSNFDTVASIADLKILNDTDALHMRCCLVENLSWFLLDRNCAETADDKAYVDCFSGNGRWVIMTPQTASIVAAVKDE